MMKIIRWVFLLSLAWLSPAFAQSNVLLNYQTATGPTQVSSSNPLPTTATVTANTSFTAASSLPTISASTGAAGYESLAGAPYVQPVFGSASGGGTQVDSSHGLPISILQSGSVLSTSNPIFVTGTGTAGSAATNPITVQGIASMTPVLVNPGTAANFGVGATSSGVPANAVYLGLSSGGSTTGAVGCNSHFYAHITSATDTLLVQGVSGQTVKVCGVTYNFSGSAAQSVYLENTASANANCSSTKTQIGPLVTGNSSAPSSPGFYNPIWGGLANTSGNGLCVNSSGSGGVDVEVWYTQGS